MSQCRVCNRAKEGHTSPKVVSEAVQFSAVKLRWIIDAEKGGIAGLEMHFADGSRVMMTTKPEVVALAPHQFSDDAKAIQPTADDA